MCRTAVRLCDGSQRGLIGPSDYFHGLSVGHKAWRVGSQPAAMIVGKVLIGTGIWIHRVGNFAQGLQWDAYLSGESFVKQNDALAGVIAWTPYPIVIAGTDRFGQAVLRAE